MTNRHHYPQEPKQGEKRRAAAGRVADKLMLNAVKRAGARNQHSLNEAVQTGQEFIAARRAGHEIIAEAERRFPRPKKKKKKSSGR